MQQRDDKSQLIAHWTFDGHTDDVKGEHPGRGHGISFTTGVDGQPEGAVQLDGRGSFVEVVDHPALRLGKEDFTIAGWVHLPETMSTVPGDFISKYDSAARRGFSLRFGASSSGCSSVSDARHIEFGLDAGTEPTWTDCGRPWPSNTLITALTTHRGRLYAGIAEATEPKGACRVFRYAGGGEWVDCGRLGRDLRALSVFSLLSHKGVLSGGPGNWDWVKADAGLRSQPALPLRRGHHLA